MSAPTDRRHPHVINLDEATLSESAHGRFAGRATRLGAAAGSRRLGCGYFEIQPGKTAFPFHWHAATEEAVYVLDGEGTLRIGDARVPVRAGDYIAFPCGPETPHQLVATGERPLRYLCMSANAEVEVCGYPDSNKLAFFATPGLGQPPFVRKLMREDGEEVGYYDGEDLGD